jgi:N-acetylmuramoyl-L-alanine amidase
MTSALAEIGFVSNPTEEAMLKDDLFRQKAAQALYNGLVQYFANK